ncbi:MAG: hypothetical protein ABSF41_17560 [Pseudolabrys sp.]|jgi:hypothetical protein
MRLKFIGTAIAAAAAMAMLAAPADAAAKKKRVVAVAGTGHTVFVSRDEDGRTRTRIIIQKRSYLDPGTERFPGERGDHDYAQLPTHRIDGVLDNTAFGSNQTALPGPFTLPLKDNPWMRF